MTEATAEAPVSLPLTPEQVDELVEARLRERRLAAMSAEQVELRLTKAQCSLVRALVLATPVQGATILDAAALLTALEDVLGPLPPPESIATRRR